MATQVVTITSNEDWIVPLGVTSLQVEGWSLGGNGGDGTFAQPGGGGGGGAYAKTNAHSVTAGNIIRITFSSGFCQATHGTGSDYIIALLSGTSASGKTAGSGGTVFVGDVQYIGGNGATGGRDASGGGGGGAGSTGNGENASGATHGEGTVIDGGDGGEGSISGTPTAGSDFGGGGAGGTKTETAGKLGGSAKIVITYEEAITKCGIPRFA